MRAKPRFVALVAVGGLSAGASLSEPAFAQGFQDPLGPGAESRALAGAVSAGTRGAQASVINPAGLGLTQHPEVYLGMGIQGANRLAPVEGAVDSVNSELELTPLPVLGVGIPVTPWLVLGGHAAPASFQGGAFQVDVAGTSVSDARAFRMLEAGPELAVVVPEELLPGALAFGFGYRVTAGELERLRAPSFGPGEVRLDLSGADGAGVRAGMQYSPIPELRLGVSWQNRVSVVLGAPGGQLESVAVSDPRTTWTVPARVTVGLRADLDRYGLALEYRLADYAGSEIVYQAESDLGLVADEETGPIWAVHSVHLGGELRLSRADFEFPLRAGFALESSMLDASSNKSPFDPPNSIISTLSFGAGLQRRAWGTNLAVATRFGGFYGREYYDWSLAADFTVRFGG